MRSSVRFGSTPLTSSASLSRLPVTSTVQQTSANSRREQGDDHMVSSGLASSSDFSFLSHSNSNNSISSLRRHERENDITGLDSIHVEGRPLAQPASPSLPLTPLRRNVSGHIARTSSPTTPSPLHPNTVINNGNSTSSNSNINNSNTSNGISGGSSSHSTENRTTVRITSWRTELVELGTIALPTVVSSTLSSLLSVIDTIFVGHILGANFMAAAALGNAFFNLMYVLLSGTAQAVEDACESSIELLLVPSADTTPTAIVEPPQESLDLPPFLAWVIEATASISAERIVTVLLHRATWSCSVCYNRGWCRCFFRSDDSARGGTNAVLPVTSVSRSLTSTVLTSPMGVTSSPGQQQPRTQQQTHSPPSLGDIAQRATVLASAVSVVLMILLALSEPILLSLLGLSEEASELVSTSASFCYPLIGGMLPLTISVALTVVLRSHRMIGDENSNSWRYLLNGEKSTDALNTLQRRNLDTSSNNNTSTTTATKLADTSTESAHPGGNLSTPANSNSQTDLQFSHRNPNRAISSQSMQAEPLQLRQRRRRRHTHKRHGEHTRSDRHTTAASGKSAVEANANVSSQLAQLQSHQSHSSITAPSSTALANRRSPNGAIGVALQENKAPHDINTGGAVIPVTMSHPHHILRKSGNYSVPPASASTATYINVPSTVPILSSTSASSSTTVTARDVVNSIFLNGDASDTAAEGKHADDIEGSEDDGEDGGEEDDAENDDNSSTSPASPTAYNSLNAVRSPLLLRENNSNSRSSVGITLTALTWHVIVISAFANVFNVALNNALITVDGFLGSPLATSLSRVLELLMLGGYLYTYRPFSAFHTWTGWDVRSALALSPLAELAKAAFTHALSIAAETWALDLTMIIIVAQALPHIRASSAQGTSEGIASISAHCVLLMFVSMLYVGVPMGLSSAVAQRLPQLLTAPQESAVPAPPPAIQATTLGPQIPTPATPIAGAIVSMAPTTMQQQTAVPPQSISDPPPLSAVRAAHAARVVVVASAVYSVLCGTIILVSRHHLSLLFTSDVRVRAAVASAAPLAAAFCVLDGVVAAASGVLNGAGRARLVSVLSVAAWWVIGLPLAILLSTPPSHRLVPLPAALEQLTALQGVWLAALLANAIQAGVFAGLASVIRWDVLAMHVNKPHTSSTSNTGTSATGTVALTAPTVTTTVPDLHATEM